MAVVADSVEKTGLPRPDWRVVGLAAVLLLGGGAEGLLDRLAETRGLPQEIVVDNGSELAGQALDEWAYRKGVGLHFIEPCRPTQNAFVEAFNGRFRKECLNENWLLDLDDAPELIEAWRIDYNIDQPHTALGYATPEDFASSLQGHAPGAMPISARAGHTQLLGLST